jgi:plastocyanin
MTRVDIPRALSRYSRLTAAGLTLLALNFSGCEQGIGGGAHYEPVVSILPDSAATEEEVAGPAAAVEVAGYGTLKGRVIVEGAVAAPPPIEPTKDAVCIAAAPIPNDQLVTGEGGSLANAFIYLPKAPGGTKTPESLDPVTFDQKGCRFIPHSMFAQAGQTILILNSDATLHNTHTNPQRNQAFNQGVQPNEKNGVPLVYARPERGPISVTCDIHPWMLAYHLVLDHPYAAVTAEDGTFEIPNLPAGRHEFTIWHEVPGVVNSRYAVEVPVDGTAEVEITIPAQSLAEFKGPHPKRVVLSMIP